MANTVQRIIVEKLHDNYDYDISFDRGGVTMITGPNGYGKTTVLNIIKNAIELKFWYFYELIFKSITIFFNTNSDKSVYLSIEKSVVIEKMNLFEEPSKSISISIKYVVGKKVMGKIILDTDRLLRLMSRRSRRYLEDSLGDRIPSYLIHRLQMKEYNLNTMNEMDYLVSEKMSAFASFVRNTNCLFIKEQRILSNQNNDEDNDDTDEKKQYTITELANQIKERYAKQKSLYSDKSQKIDSSFIKRLSKDENRKEYKKDEYTQRVRELEFTITKYNRYNLISNYKFQGKYDAKLSSVYSLYLDDAFEKLGVYEPFYKQLSLFDSFVNGKGLSNKKMILNEIDGISFVSDNGLSVPLHKLSSGEQNLVILYYRLVFETEPGTLMLIDEPENSLHVEWQSHMLDDYLTMDHQLECQMLIATHSPTFIDDHWDISFDLASNMYMG